MNDNEIIKALEHCKQHIGKHDCKNCPYVLSIGMCTTNMLNDTINLIKRQKAEIEKYKQEQNETTAMLDRLGVILFGSREEWEKKLIAYIDMRRKEHKE